MVLIAYEGQTDKNFLIDILSSYSLNESLVIYENFEGKDNLLNYKHKYYDEIRNRTTKDINRILLIADADNKKDKNPNRGFDKTKKALDEVISNLDYSIDVEYYIMCDTDKNGTLESFLLSVLDEKQQECIETFKECYKYNLSDKWIHNSLYKQKKDPLNFNHKNFSLLKKKLLWLFESIVKK